MAAVYSPAIVTQAQASLQEQSNLWHRSTVVLTMDSTAVR
jgi:hypothetical protein